MRYQNIKKGTFLDRPNRFIAHVMIDGERIVCHVKNTGRCRELLVPGCTVLLEPSQSPQRKTPYDLVAVYKGDLLINMDSQAPNRAFGEWAATTDYFGELLRVQPEYTYGSSRLDFYLETKERKILVEVKGVTLEENGVVLFPDAPTERGVKHVLELAEAAQKGYDTYLFFVIQMETCRYFTPNRVTHPAFADALKTARAAGVHLRAIRCQVTEDSMALSDFVPIVL